ncbi:MAG: glycosyl transferase family 2, partial [Planctomycetota bacterium]
SSQQSLWTGRKRHGFGQWFMGTSFPYMFASAVFRMTRPPYLVGGIGMLVGYLGSALRRERRYEDPEFRRFLRRYQREGLIHGKAEATKRAEERHAHLFKTGAPRDPACT